MSFYRARFPGQVRGPGHSLRAAGWLVSGSTTPLDRRYALWWAKDAGVYMMTWDGRDASGAAVASGSYLYRLDADGGAERDQNDDAPSLAQECLWRRQTLALQCHSVTESRWPGHRLP